MKYPAACFLTALATSVFTPLASGVIIAQDDFDALAPGTIDGQGIASGGYDSNTWGVHNGGSGTDYVVTAGSPLSTGNYLVGDTSNGAFNQGIRGLDNRGSSGDFAAYISDSDNFNNDLDIDQGVLYLGFLSQFDSSAANKSYFGVDNSRFSNGAGKDSSVYIGKLDATSSSNYSLIYDGTSDGSSNLTGVDTGIALGGSPVQWVLKLDLDNDSVTAWADPLNEATSPTATANLDADGLFFQSFRMNRNLVVDDVILGSSFNDIVPIPEPRTLAVIFGLFSLGLIAVRRRRS